MKSRRFTAINLLFRLGTRQKPNSFEGFHFHFLYFLFEQKLDLKMVVAVRIK